MTAVHRNSIKVDVLAKRAGVDKIDLRRGLLRKASLAEKW